MNNIKIYELVTRGYCKYFVVTDDFISQCEANEKVKKLATPHIPDEDLIRILRYGNIDPETLNRICVSGEVESEYYQSKVKMMNIINTDDKSKLTQDDIYFILEKYSDNIIIRRIIYDDDRESDIILLFSLYNDGHYCLRLDLVCDNEEEEESIEIISEDEIYDIFADGLLSYDDFNRVVKDRD